MTWSMFSQLADVLGDGAAALAVFWLIAIEIRLRQVQLVLSWMGPIIANDPEFKERLKEAARWKLL